MQPNARLPYFKGCHMPCRATSAQFFQCFSFYRSFIPRALCTLQRACSSVLSRAPLCGSQRPSSADVSLGAASKRFIVALVLLCSLRWDFFALLGLALLQK